jgi:hypothetical protein
VTDQEQRQTARILLDAAQLEADAGRGFLVPAGTLPNLLPPERLTLDAARRSLGIEDRVWDREHHRHLIVCQLVGKRARRAS